MWVFFHFSCLRQLSILSLPCWAYSARQGSKKTRFRKIAGGSMNTGRCRYELDFVQKT